MSFFGVGVLERLKSVESHKRKSRLDGGKEEVKRRKDELVSHLESIQLLCVGGLLPLQTVRQLRADLSRRVKKTTPSPSRSPANVAPPHSLLVPVCSLQ